jgi:hypothetical protein
LTRALRLFVEDVSDILDEATPTPGAADTLRDGADALALSIVNAIGARFFLERDALAQTIGFDLDEAEARRREAALRRRVAKWLAALRRDLDRQGRILLHDVSTDERSGWISALVTFKVWIVARLPRIAMLLVALTLGILVYAFHRDRSLVVLVERSYPRDVPVPLDCERSEPEPPPVAFFECSAMCAPDLYAPAPVEPCKCEPVMTKPAKQPAEPAPEDDEPEPTEDEPDPIGGVEPALNKEAEPALNKEAEPALNKEVEPALIKEAEPAPEKKSVEAPPTSKDMGGAVKSGQGSWSRTTREYYKETTRTTITITPSSKSAKNGPS